MKIYFVHAEHLFSTFVYVQPLSVMLSYGKHFVQEVYSATTIPALILTCNI